MKADKLLDALNYIDDDLIAECDKVRSGESSKVTRLPRKKMSRARVTAIWGSVAAAAVVLVVGFFVLNLNKDADKASSHKRHDRHDSVNKSEEFAGMAEDLSKDEALEDHRDYIAAPQETTAANGFESPEIESEDKCPVDFSEYTLGQGYGDFFDVADEPELIEALSRATVTEATLPDEDPIIYSMVDFYNEDGDKVTFFIEYINPGYYIEYFDKDNNKFVYSISKTQAMKLTELIREIE